MCCICFILKVYMKTCRACCCILRMHKQKMVNKKSEILVADLLHKM